jgi:hypothetical protein
MLWLLAQQVAELLLPVQARIEVGLDLVEVGAHRAQVRPALVVGGLFDGLA